MQLASEPGEWEIVLGGITMQLLAHGFSVEHGEYIFTLLMEGDPPCEVVVARLQCHAVESITGG